MGTVQVTIAINATTAITAVTFFNILSSLVMGYAGPGYVPTPPTAKRLVIVIGPGSSYVDDNPCGPVNCYEGHTTGN